MDARQREQLIADLYVGLVFDRRPGLVPSVRRRGEVAKKAIALADELIEELEASDSGREIDRRSHRGGDNASDRA
jgi:hypothetical protein